MVRAQRPVTRQQIARRLVLLLQRLRRLDAGEPAEIILGEDLDPELFGFLQLLAAIDRSEALGADDDHRRLRVDVVGGGAAKPRDQRRRVFAAEGIQFSGEHDKLSRERLCIR